MSTLKVGTIQDPTNSNTAISIDSSGNVAFTGRVLMANQPSFQGGWTTNQNQSTTIVCDQVWHNIGNHYDTSNGQFTCPVAGRYLVTFFGMTAATNYQMDIEMRKNGSTFNVFAPYTSQYDNNSNYPFAQTSGSAIVQVAANDVLTLYINSAGSLYGNVNNGRHTGCGFHLLG